MSRKIISVAILAVMALTAAEAQDMRKLQETFIEAEYFLLYEEYNDALIYYLELHEALPDNYNLAYRIGICYLNIPGRKAMAIEYLEKAAKNSRASYREGSINQRTAPYEAIFFLGEAYHVTYQFDKAREAFMKYREVLLPDDTENILFVDHQIEVCDFAKELIASPVQFTEENIGPLFNDERPNYNPVISADGNTFAYMVSLKFYDAIMVSRKGDGDDNWSPPVNIIPEVQIDGNITISSLSADGNRIFITKSDNFESDIYTSTFDGFQWSPAVKLNRNINTRNWESHGFITEDGNYLIFASDRPGGFGGLDLYISRWENNDWGPAVNLGTEINTPFNEDRPFLINDGITLFFSSQGHYNIGGYDVFRSDRQPNGLWGKPENLGYPVNTPDDDTFFMPVENGQKGYVSWLRPGSETFGGRDIYLIRFTNR